MKYNEDFRLRILTQRRQGAKARSRAHVQAPEVQSKHVLSALTPALSRRRGRIAFRLIREPAAGLVEHSSELDGARQGDSLSWGEGKGGVVVIRTFLTRQRSRAFKRPVYSSLFQLYPTYSPVTHPGHPTYSSLFQGIPTYSSIFPHKKIFPQQTGPYES